MNGPLRIGIGGPVGAGKTTLTECLCRAMAGTHSMAVITNDIYTREDADHLLRVQALPEARIRGVETGGCPHTAIREDASINLRAVADLTENIPDLDVILIESGGDNLAATFSPAPCGRRCGSVGARRRREPGRTSLCDGRAQIRPRRA